MSLYITGPGWKSTLSPVDGGGCLILNRQESIPTFFMVTGYEYVQPSLSTPKSTRSGRSTKPRSFDVTSGLMAPDTDAVLTWRRTGSSTFEN